MEDMNRLNTVRTDRLMTPLETEIAAMNLHSVETSIKMKREAPLTIVDRIETYVIVGILVVTVIAALLGVGA